MVKPPPIVSALAPETAATPASTANATPPEFSGYRSLELVTGYSERHMRRMIRAGTFPAPLPLADRRRKLGWDPADVAAWIAAKGSAQ
jgi:predicted DNA-binding transcriptional regulator AlpA